MPGGRAARQRERQRPAEPMPWVAHVPKGFEAVACAEVKDRLGVNADRVSAGEVQFTPDDDADPLDLRCAELCFLRVLEVPSPPEERAGPRELMPAVRRAVPAVLAAARRARSAQLGRERTVRFVVRMDGWYPYPRQALRDRIEKDVPGLLGQRFRLAQDGAGLELWVTAGERSLTLDVRISPEEHRHRSYKQEHLAGSLRPAVAACLVRHSSPSGSDVMCDPFCGAGTIALERAHYGLPYRAILAGDCSEQACAATAANFGPRHQPRLICRWDVRRLPLASGVADVAVTNLPFGGKSAARDLGDLYAAALREISRILQPGGRAVLLAEQAGLLGAAAGGVPKLRPTGTLRVEVQGRPAVVGSYRREA